MILRIYTPFSLLTLTAVVCGLVIPKEEFDCGEGKYVDSTFLCDGDADCFLGNDESDELCSGAAPFPGPGISINESRISWLTKFLDKEYTSLGGCGQPDVLPKFRYRGRRLVGGEEAIRGSWPWQTALVKGEDNLVYCAGTLIHRKWVLTAAHCIESLKGDIKNLELWFGKHDVTDEEVASQKRNALKTFKHENHRYPTHKSNDIALVKLERPVEITPYVQLACMPNISIDQPQRHCYLAGWGRVSGPGDEVLYPAELLQLRFPMVSHKLCVAKEAWGPRITGKQICAGGDGIHDMCWGDSGGGLVCSRQGQYTVEGISSFTGHLCAVENRPAIFTKVHKYLSWISRIMQSESKHTS